MNPGFVRSVAVIWTGLIRGKAIMLLPLFLALPSAAQTLKAVDLPVVDIVQDYQGVDVNSGAYVAGSPFSFAAPGASHLAISTSFNGRKSTHSLNTYLTDETYNEGGHTSRELTVNYQGKARFFRCPGVGVCEQLGFKDGSRLLRLSMRTLVGGSDPYAFSGDDQYQFISREGAIVSFFNPYYAAAEICPNPDGYCNLARYTASTYASAITFPNGEKLTFETFPTLEQDGSAYRAAIKIQSNLGYELKFATLLSGSTIPATTAGRWWWHHLVGEVMDLRITLTRANLFQGQLSIKRTYQNEQQSGFTYKALKQIEEQDTLGRKFTLNFITKPAPTCVIPDFTMPSIAKMTTPGGVVTDVAYHTAPNYVKGIWEVATVTRGGIVWSYTYNEPGRAGTTSTDVNGGKRTTNSGNIPSALTQYLGSCPPPVIPANPIRQTDELSRQKNYTYDPVTLSVSSVTNNEGNGLRYVRDNRDNIKEVYEKAKNGSERLIYQADYDGTCSNTLTCNQPNWVRDAIGNQTDYKYSEVHGGVIYETRPQASGSRLRTYYFYETVDLGGGNLHRLAKIQRCGLTGTDLTNRTDCPTGAGTATTTSVQNMSYGDVTTAPNTYNTFLPYQVSQTDGNNSLSATTTYVYDATGRLTSTDGPLAGSGDKTYTTYDAGGRKVCDIGIDPDDSGPLVRAMIRHTYNNDDTETRTDTGYGSNTTDCRPGTEMTLVSFVRRTVDSVGRVVKSEQVQP
jgi:hypothetical protein